MMKKRANMKRKIPVFFVQMNGESYEVFQQHPIVKKIVIEELIFAIKDGLKRNKKSISLFSISNSGFVLELDKANWKQSLQSALDYFVEKENYDKCIEIRDLIQKI